MRKEVKLGLAIGGVLLAVLIVYVLAVSGGSKKQVAQTDGAAAGGGNVSLEPVDGDAPGTAPVPPAAPPTQYDPPAGGATDPFAPTARSGAAAPSDAQASSTSRKDDWNKILNDQLVLMTETPQVVGGARGAAAPVEPAAAPAVESPAAAPVESPVPAPRVEAPAAPTVSAPIVSAPAAEPVAPAPPVPPTVQPSDVTPAPPAPTSIAPAPAGREYAVQAGETLSSIAAAVYGNANFYPHILRANPNINPDRIRPGTKIILPDISAVRPASSDGSAAASSSSSTAPLDASRQYRVQPGDSLHKIALRLYGDSIKSESLYQLNKQMIGADPHRLKVGQVLSLPDPPTAR
jgi:nucleoid-associated protein YgaU